MTTTSTQIFNPSFSNPDDMPIFISIWDQKPKKTKACKLSDEQKKERARFISKRYYDNNREYCVQRQFIYDEKKRNTN
jgi:hypothetical protein